MLLLGVLSIRDFILAARNHGKLYLATFLVHLLYKVFYWVRICLGWVGVILSVYASVDVW